MPFRIPIISAMAEIKRETTEEVGWVHHLNVEPHAEPEQDCPVCNTWKDKYRAVYLQKWNAAGYDKQFGEPLAI